MTNFLREHRRYVLVFILLAVTVPLAFYGVGNFGTGNDSGPIVEAVGKVGDIPIPAQAFLQQYEAMSRMKSQQGQRAEAKDLLADGTIDNIMTYLKNDALMTLESRKLARRATDEFLAEKLKETPSFTNEDGTFNAEYWNQIVKTNAVRDWGAVYADVNDQLNREKLLEVMAASARVFDSDLRDEFKKSKTKIKVKYAPIQPKVDLTEEQVREQYDTRLDAYMTEEQRQAEFVAISLNAGRPALLDEIVAKAHAGEDFSDLATQYSEAASKGTGGDIGWVVETANIQDFRKPLFTMAVGDVSDPIEGPTGWYIYTVEEERTNALGGKRDVKAREILVRPKLTDEEKEARLARARKIADAARTDSDLKAATEAEGLAIQTTNAFTASAPEITGVDPIDALAFRTALAKVEKGAVADIIEARQNVYVAKMIEVTPPAQKTFEEAREDVERNAIAVYKQTPEYLASVERYVKDIKDAKLKNLQEIATKFPELTLETKETKIFGKTDFLFSDGIFWQTTDAIDLFVDAEVGTMDGPLFDFSNGSHFLELTEKEGVNDSIWETEWPAERQKLADEALAQAQRERQVDYLQHLREQAQAQFLIQEDGDAIIKLLGLDQPDTPAQDTAPTSDSATAVDEAGAGDNASAPVTAGDTTDGADSTTATTEAPAPESAPSDSTAQPPSN
ncbi:MAG: SurA N-terminal domain-containing protein [Candidatus Hydrogenedentota bacterium]